MLHNVRLGGVVDAEFPEFQNSSELRSEMASTLLEAAVAEVCRSTVELVGHARDRRAFNYIQEVF